MIRSLGSPQGRVPCGEENEMIGERWQQVLRDGGDHPALMWDGGAMSFQELDAAARAFDMVGPILVARGDPPELVVAMLAGFLRGRPVQFVEKDREPRVPVSSVPEETCLIKQTAGGSGVRRCQFFNEVQLLADVDRLHAALELADRGVILASLSQAHSYGLTVGALQTLFHGVSMHWVANPFPGVMAEAMKHHAKVFLPGVPAMWKAWLLGGLPMPKVALAVSAGSPLTLELERRVRESHGIKLHNLYGASECGAISYDGSDVVRDDPRDLGTALPGVTCSTGARGCLQIESDAVGLGYDQTLPGEQFGAGVFHTCDRIEILEGRLLFGGSEGRGINVAGRKLSPVEIEEKIQAGLTRSDVVVRVESRVSRDPERCEEIVAVIEASGPLLDEDFRRAACQHLAPWEVPRAWRQD